MCIFFVSVFKYMYCSKAKENKKWRRLSEPSMLAVLAGDHGVPVASIFLTSPACSRLIVS